MTFPSLKHFAKCRPKITACKTLLNSMNLWLNSHEPSVIEHMAILIGSDLSAELTFAHTLVSIFGSILNFL